MFSVPILLRLGQRYGAPVIQNLFFIEVKADLKGFSKTLHETYCNHGMEHGTSTGTVAEIHLQCVC